MGAHGMQTVRLHQALVVLRHLRGRVQDVVRGGLRHDRRAQARGRRRIRRCIRRRRPKLRRPARGNPRRRRVRIVGRMRRHPDARSRAPPGTTPRRRPRRAHRATHRRQGRGDVHRGQRMRHAHGMRRIRRKRIRLRPGPRRRRSRARAHRRGVPWSSARQAPDARAEEQDRHRLPGFRLRRGGR